MLNNKKYYDISVPLDKNLIIWPGMPKIQLKYIKSITHGDKVNNGCISMDLHSGTHIDAPLHFIPSGKSIDQLDLTKTIGPVYVMEISEEIITMQSIINKKIPQGVSRILFKTNNSKKIKNNIFFNKYVALSQDAAQYLIQTNIDLVGIDYLSIESQDIKGKGVHNILLSSNVVILEGLNLSEVREGFYDLIALPINIKGFESAPTRAILVEK